MNVVRFEDRDEEKGMVLLETLKKFRREAELPSLEAALGELEVRAGRPIQVVDRLPGPSEGPGIVVGVTSRRAEAVARVPCAGCLRTVYLVHVLPEEVDCLVICQECFERLKELGLI